MEYRTFDGSNNDLANPTYNAAGSDMTRIGTKQIGPDGGIVEGPNPRLISNVVVAGDGDLPNTQGLSGMMYAWGQFVVHDIEQNKDDGQNHIDITVPKGDPQFAPGSSILLTRAVTDPNNGNAVNSITSWLDGSTVYGSSEEQAASLRNAAGYLNTASGPDGSDLPIVDGKVVAGDSRAAENPSLTALHTLFVREHNYQVDQLKQQHPDWTGDQLYQQARAIVIGEIEHITYSEFLPHLLGPNAIAPYHGYDPSVDPRITAEFAAGAMRFGDSIIATDNKKLDERGNVLASDDLKTQFFQPPQAFNENGGAGAILRHLASDPSRKMDVHIAETLRSFLVNPPDGQDLAAINIQRDRDLGLGTLNQTREALGLQAYTDFNQITSDPTVAANLKAVYGDVDKIDLWMGGVAEDHAPGSFVGETFSTIITQQFENLRDGDCLWYQNQGLDQTTLDQINHTKLSDVILRNTDTKTIQSDAFQSVDRHNQTMASNDPNGPQLVVGTDAPNAHLMGGPNDDTIVAGLGPDQLLTGNGGHDTFVFHGDGHTASITDFDAGLDKLAFDMSPQDFKVTGADGHAVIQVSHNVVNLLNMTPDQVTPDMVVFHPSDTAMV